MRPRLPAKAISIRLALPDIKVINRDRLRLGYPTRSSCIRSAILNLLNDVHNATPFVLLTLEVLRRLALLLRAEVTGNEQALKLVNQMLREIDSRQQLWMTEKGD